MPTAIVTGPTGTVGVSLLNKLLQEDYFIYAIVREHSHRISNLPVHKNIKVVNSNLENLALVYENILGTVDVFYHLAWEGTTGQERNDPYIQNQNVKYSLDAVNLAAALECNTFIGIGSQAEYGRTNEKLSGLTPAFPESAYGAAKLCAGHLTRLLCEQVGIRHVWARILSVYGPYDNENSMLISAMQKMLNGDTTSFTKGEQIWDYLYSSDAAEALFLLSKYGIDGKTYCIGSGVGKSLSEYILALQKIVNPTAKVGLGDIPYGDKQVMYLCADIRELQKDTGFSPKISFEQGIRQTTDWYKKKLGL